MTSKDLDWSDKFSTDIVSIDRQHQELLYMSQSLLSILGDEDVQLADKRAAFQSLVDHALAHFDYEERVMHNIGYPKVDEHTQEHEDLRQEIATMLDTVMNGDKTSDWKGLVSLVQVWVLRHIVHSDTLFREHIQHGHNDEP
ncbi:MAG TPA: bacteriohemerythrin [Magnetovibrio sp.]